MLRVVITGALGYVGSQLSSHLANCGYQCDVYDTGYFKDFSLYPPAKVNISGLTSFNAFAIIIDILLFHT